MAAPAAATLYDEATASQAWYDLEMDAWKARSGGRGRGPTAKIPREWEQIPETNRPAMFNGIRNWRNSVEDLEAADEPGDLPATDDVATNNEYNDAQSRKIELLDAVLTNVQALVTTRGTRPDTNGTVIYLTTLQGEWQTDRDGRWNTFNAIQTWNTSVAAYEAAPEPAAVPAADDVGGVADYYEAQTAKIDLLGSVLTNLGALITIQATRPDTEDIITYLNRRQDEWQTDRNSRTAAWRELEAAHDIWMTANETPEPERKAREEREQRRNSQRIVKDNEASLDAARLLRAELDPVKGWVNGPHLGTGEFGSVTAWFRQDVYGRIVDRVAIKDAKTIHVNETDNLDIEVVAMYRLRPLKGSESVVAIRNFRPDFEDGSRIRIFMEYCPVGTLWSLIERYNTYNNQTLPDQPTAHIPEAYIWHVFESLAQAGLLMATGDVDANNALSSKWEQIVHCDLKPHNLLLGNASKDSFRGYPQVKVGDFGIAMTFARQPTPLGRCTIALDRERNKRTALQFQQGRRKPCRWSAPEERNPDLAGAKTLPVFSSATNVWGIGMQIYSLIAKSEGDAGFEDDEWSEPRVPTDVAAEETEYYSPHLLDLVRRCTAYLPDDRIGFKELLKKIRERRSDKRKAAADELRHAPASDSLWRKHSLLLGRERYALGLVLIEEAQDDDKWPGNESNCLPLPRPKEKDRDTGGSDSEDSDSSDDLGGPQGEPANLPKVKLPTPAPLPTSKPNAGRNNSDDVFVDGNDLVGGMPGAPANLFKTPPKFSAPPPGNKRDRVDSLIWGSPLGARPGSLGGTGEASSSSPSLGKREVGGELGNEGSPSKVRKGKGKGKRVDDEVDEDG